MKSVLSKLFLFLSLTTWVFNDLLALSQEKIFSEYYIVKESDSIEKIIKNKIWLESLTNNEKKEFFVK